MLIELIHFPFSATKYSYGVLWLQISKITIEIERKTILLHIHQQYFLKITTNQSYIAATIPFVLTF